MFLSMKRLLLFESVIFIYLMTIIILIPGNTARKHRLILENELRPLIHITAFGFFKNGFLDVKLDDLVVQPTSGTEHVNIDNLNNKDYTSTMRLRKKCQGKRFRNGASIGFTVDRTMSDGTNPYPTTVDSSNCPLSQDEEFMNTNEVQRISFSFDFTKNLVHVACSRVLQHVKIFNNQSGIPHMPGHSKRTVTQVRNMYMEQRKKRDTDAGQVDSANKSLLNAHGSYCSDITLDLIPRTIPDGSVSYSTQFVVLVCEDCEGLYNLYFHYCGDDMNKVVKLNMSLVEQNRENNYLSAGEMPLPALYLMISFLFFISGCFWVFTLKKSIRETGVSVFKIHYLMGALVFLKSLSLLFHSINYHKIQMYGTNVETWAVLYYITHLLKGTLLFITILLIGTGYDFVKRLLSNNDKRIFMIVIPLQALANVAEIIIEESEEGEIVHTTWKVIFIWLDLICCGAILFPVVWTIRHLQDIYKTDGKPATNLSELRLFRHFYMIVVCYIYFTRIVVNMLLKITVPFQYQWLVEMFREMTTFIFFILVGYKFRPAKNNPRLQLTHDSDDEDLDTAYISNNKT